MSVIKRICGSGNDKTVNDVLGGGLLKLGMMLTVMVARITSRKYELDLDNKTDVFLCMCVQLWASTTVDYYIKVTSGVGAEVRKTFCVNMPGLGKLGSCLAIDLTMQKLRKRPY